MENTRSIDVRIERLIQRIATAFSATAPSSNLLVADGMEDDFGRSEINEAFDLRSWIDVPASTVLDRFDCSELSYHLSSRGFFYYLPAFMTQILRSRKFGWFERLLVPPMSGFEDVARQFGDGNLFPFDLPGVERQKLRLDYAIDHLTGDQRACIGEYVRIAETYNGPPLTDDFAKLLEKYASFWESS